MAKRKRKYVKLQCQECGHINYYVHKSKGATGKLKLRKFCKHCGKETIHKEVK